MTAITTRIYTALCGQHVGTDQFGNRYYRRKGKTHGTSSVADKRKAEKRWVIYNGKAEPTKIPPEWHGWMHYTHDAPQTGKRYDWQKPHLPNLTGTVNAYVPPGHLIRGGHRSPTTSDYEAWKP